MQQNMESAASSGELSGSCDHSFSSMAPVGPYKLDEGYSEDARSLDDGDSAMGLDFRTGSSTNLLADPLISLHNAMMSLNEAQRSEHAYQVLRTLRTSSIAAIVDLLTPLLHIDPVARLPPELTSLIFSYLPPAALLEASKVSKAWRARTLDSRLWKQKFISEGWTLDKVEVRNFEENYSHKLAGSKRGSRKAEDGDEEPQPKRRVVGIHSQSDILIDKIGGVGEHSGPSISQARSRDEEMHDVGTQSESSGVWRPAVSISSSMFTEPASIIDTLSLDRKESASSTEMDVDTQDPMMIPVSSSAFRLNYHHVYKQRRKLEDNWTAGRFKSFQLPHQDYPEEAHNECVYTIQYSGRYLVSGSRDKTLRIWNLDTQRLLTRPLSGHNGSVLCLQFDASPEEDIIVSGSSDTDVILWQFSTGRLIKRIAHAHSESVLNLKFDHRYLVTCSKDKQIKIWNRQELQPGDENYPIRGGVQDGVSFPAYIVDLTGLNNPRDMQQHLTPEQLTPIPEYSLIMRIESHSAAVNAVHIFQDQLVSASGDRDIKVFNIRTGANTALCKGHNKGIACVQYDGRRIVSGSSDDTIRIFDPATQAEVGCLSGHSKLVRTVQAAFGDQPGTEDDLEAEARDVDRAYFEAMRKGEVPPIRPRPRHMERRNPGSRRPQDITVLGAKLPPGGGGSRWARIISGSYDETIIIWRKAPDGRWVIGQRLKQADALKAAGGPLLSRSERHEHAARMAAVHQVVQQHNHQGLSHLPAIGPATQALQSAMQATQASSSVWTQHGTLPPQRETLANPPTASQIAHAQAIQATWHNAQSQAQAQAQAQAAAQQAAHLHAVQAAQAAAQAAAHAHHQGQNARVFKLQFDARRIICCSQDPKIVGWDFANGDEEVIECSKFFAHPN